MTLLRGSRAALAPILVGVALCVCSCAINVERGDDPTKVVDTIRTPEPPTGGSSGGVVGGAVATSTAAAPVARIVTASPVASAAAFGQLEWSPDGSMLTVISYTSEAVATAVTMGGFLGFVEGQLVVHSAQTGITCTRYDAPTLHGHEGPSPNNRMWLDDGRLLISTKHGRTIAVTTPCIEDEDVTDSLPTVPDHFGGMAPDGRLIVLGDGWWLIDPQNWSAVILEGVEGDVTNELVWSPDKRLIAAKVDWANGTELSSTRVVDAATGRLVARHDWSGMETIGGTLGRTTWLDNRRVLIPITLDQGPLILASDGTVSSALEPFGVTFEPRPVHETDQMTDVQGHFDPDTGHTHLLLSDSAWPEPDSWPVVALLHEETGTLEPLTDVERGNTGMARLTADGWIQLFTDDVASRVIRRPLDPPGSPFEALVDDPCGRVDVQGLSVRLQEAPQLDVVTRECEVVDRLRLQMPDTARWETARISPDGQHVALVARNRESDPTALLYVLPVHDPRGSLSVQGRRSSPSEEMP